MSEICKAAMTKPAQNEAMPQPSAANSTLECSAGDIRTSEATVVLATHSLDRWPFLVAAIESVLAEPQQPAGIVLCVDKNEDLYRRARSTWPDITVVTNNGMRGASGARNSGADFAKTAFVVFIDDDVRVRRGWLHALLQPFKDPAVVGTGGGVTPQWQKHRPAWFPEEFDWVVGASYKGMPTTNSVVRNVWSENMAIRTEAFGAAGGFRSGFGKVGNLSRPEDTDLCIRVTRNSPGSHWVYVPEAQVRHHVPESRSSLSFFLRRNYHEGRGKVEMARLLGRQESLDTERDYLRRTLPAGVATGMANTIIRKEITYSAKALAIVAGASAAAFGALCGTAAQWKAAGISAIHDEIQDRTRTAGSDRP